MRNEKFEERMTAGQVAQHRRHGRLDDDVGKQKMTQNFMNLDHIHDVITAENKYSTLVSCLGIGTP